MEIIRQYLGEIIAIIASSGVGMSLLLFAVKVFFSNKSLIKKIKTLQNTEIVSKINELITDNLNLKKLIEEKDKLPVELQAFIETQTAQNDTLRRKYLQAVKQAEGVVNAKLRTAKQAAKRVLEEAPGVSEKVKKEVKKRLVKKNKSED